MFTLKIDKKMRNYSLQYFQSNKGCYRWTYISYIEEANFQVFRVNGTYKWIHILSEIVRNYNNVKHRKIKMKSVDVTENTALTTFNQL